MIRAYDEYGNIIDLVEWEKHIRETAIDDFIKAADKHCGYYAGECRNLTRDDLLCIANNMKLRSDG